MTIDEIVEKSIPPILIGLTFSISMLFIKVNTLENKAQELVGIAEDYKNDTHQKQWNFISKSKEKVVQLEERCITKDTYYKDKLKGN